MDNGVDHHQIKQTLGLADMVAVVAGIVIGSGIFKLPGLVAANCGSASVFMLLWVVGGAISMSGALCYAELATAYPNAGGDYYFISRAYGRGMGFIFAWARMVVIQPGSIAYLGFFIGDYLSGILSLGAYSSSIYAAAAAVGLTALNVLGIKAGKWTQALSTLAITAGLLIVAAIGFASAPAAGPAAVRSGSGGSIGMAMVFVLLAFGGWNESAYVSAEVKEPGRNIVRALVLGMALVTAIYLAVNWAYLRALGLGGVAGAANVAQDMVMAAAGERWAALVTFCVVFAALSTTNATIMSGARSNYAFGRDYRLFGRLGRWNSGRGTPAAALVVQCCIALALIALGNAIDVRTGFETMVAYTTPVFWFFFFLSGLSVFVLRRKDPGTRRLFKVPFYPVTPALFCIACLYMLKNGFDYIALLPRIGIYSGAGAAVGVAALLCGLPLLALNAFLERKAGVGAPPAGQ